MHVFPNICSNNNDESSGSKKTYLTPKFAVILIKLHFVHNRNIGFSKNKNSLR